MGNAIKIRLNQASPVAFHARSTALELIRVVRATMLAEDGRAQLMPPGTLFDASVDLRITIYADGTVDFFDTKPENTGG